MARRKRTSFLDDPPCASSSDEVMEEPASEAEEETPAKTPPAEKDTGDCNKASAKRKKTSSKDPKVVSHKVWSEGDEIVILKGMLELAASNNWSRDNPALKELVKNTSFLLEEDFTTQQLKDKIRSLKRKYNRCRPLSDPHEIKVFHLSHQLWGHEPGPTQTPEPKPTTKPVPKHTPEPGPGPTQTLKTKTAAPAGDDWAVLGEILEGSSLPKHMRTRGLALVSDDRKDDLAAQCKQIFLSQIELNGKKNLLTSKLYRLIFKALTSDK